jgi:hypothetical protein
MIEPYGAFCVLLSIAYIVLLWQCAVEPRWSALWRPLWGPSGGLLWERSGGRAGGPSVERFWDRVLGALCGVLLWSLSGALSYFGLKDIYYMLVWVFCFKGL